MELGSENIERIKDLRDSNGLPVSKPRTPKELAEYEKKLSRKRRFRSGGRLFKKPKWTFIELPVELRDQVNLMIDAGLPVSIPITPEEVAEYEKKLSPQSKFQSGKKFTRPSSTPVE